MISKLSISLISALACSYAFANPPGKAEDVAYAIENPLRPGAKAPYCETQTEAFDGCTFHSVAGDAYRAKLMVKQGETWVASTSDAATIKLGRCRDQSRGWQDLLRSSRSSPARRKTRM